MKSSNIDPANYPAVWNEHRRVTILHDRCQDELMEALGYTSLSVLEEKLLLMRIRSIADWFALSSNSTRWTRCST